MTFENISKVLRFALAGLLIAVIVLGALWLRSCGQGAQHTAQSRVDQGQGAAFHNSAAAAVNAVSDVAANQAAAADIGRQNEEDIRHAKGADLRVDADANVAGLRALCRRASHRDDPACRVQQPRP